MWGDHDDTPHTNHKRYERLDNLYTIGVTELHFVEC